MFPFKKTRSNGEEVFEFSHCTHLEGSGDGDVEKHWCATSTDENGFYKDWGYCDTRTCKKGEALNSCWMIQ